MVIEELKIKLQTKRKFLIKNISETSTERSFCKHRQYR